MNRRSLAARLTRATAIALVPTATLLSTPRGSARFLGRLEYVETLALQSAEETVEP